MIRNHVTRDDRVRTWLLREAARVEDTVGFDCAVAVINILRSKEAV